MLDRREFLRRSLFLAGGATLLPSQVWPYKKIFIPPEPKIYTPPHLMGIDANFRMDWNDGLWTISGQDVFALYQEIVKVNKRYAGAFKGAYERATK